MSIEEYEQSVAMMVDQAAGRLIIIHQAVFNNLDENLDAVARAEAAGAELVLLGYPPYSAPARSKMCTTTRGRSATPRTSP